MTADINDIIYARTNCVFISEFMYRDLYNIAENLSFIEGASELMNEISNTVIHFGQKGFPEIHGLSVYFPYWFEFDPEYPSYNAAIIDFPGDSLWDDFLNDYFETVINTSN